MATKHHSSVPLDNLTAREFMMLANVAFLKLGWQAGDQSESEVVAKTDMSASSWGEEVRVVINGDTADIYSRCTGSQVIDWGKNKRNVNRLIDTMSLLRSQYTPEQLEEQYNQRTTTLENEAEAFAERYQQGKLTATDKLSMGYGGHYVTYTLIAINLIVFILMVIRGVGIMNPTGAEILAWGGNMRMFTASGEWWRLITCVFVHIGIIHLLFNMYALYSIGLFLEPLLGRWKFLAAYLATGVLASITSMWWAADRVSAGASGAIFGLYGFFLALLTTNYIDRHARKALLQSILVFVGFNLVYGLKGNIDNAAHIGGLVSGFVMGYVFYLLHTKSKAALFIPAALAIALVISVPVMSTMGDDTVKFDKVWNEFAVLEEKAMRPMQRRDSLTASDFIQQAESISMPAWTEIKALLESTNKYKLPAATIRQRDLLKRYIDLRILYTQTWIATEKDQTEENLSKMDSLSKEIEAIIDEMNKSLSQ